ncbi:DNA polymerase III subunit alpha [Xylanibacillus composti]|uniref:DNA polymerase III subunit alpha n=1 Tax=Xylanibacillus composti TaxID=1572762 RepID=A0A8J4M3C0_9BACL|nr:DNA polymerase III subunit alpha [Xylanibacillus composti]MDT9724785.1 DNA polymerase III subunit alpha [Xylanibacillus composti]GIQ69862.1 DNA-directed DNA polymerase [Xylanibacillus composti]
MGEFVHLHVHSEYSLLDGAARISDLVKQASAHGMKALALTDHGVMYGAIAFYQACQAHGIKPIIGCEAYVTEGSRKQRGSRQDQRIYHLILLARNSEGYRNLMRLCSIGHLEGFHYKPRVDLEALAAHAEGITALSACLGGEVAQALLADRMDMAREAALRYRGIFGEHFYLELQDHGLIEQRKVNQKLIELSRETGIPLVATNDVHYLQPEDQTVQDTLICIGTGKTVEDDDRLKMHTNQMYLKSGAEMEKLFPHCREALEATVRIADACNLDLTFGRTALPHYFPVPEGQGSGSFLQQLCAQGLKERYAALPEWQDGGWRAQAEQRLAYELQVIGKMGYEDYFLIVWDFIRYAKERGIAVGPGRGSSAGSLVAYALAITDVDPLKYGLLFERFLNPERVTMPDIDIDFSDERRDEVIDYVADKYGTDRVAQIITFGTMAAKAAVRDVGRALGFSYADVDRIAKMIPAQLGITIDKALEQSSSLQAAVEQDSKARELIEVARKVEGMPRHASTHAAGVVISKDALTDHVPLQTGTEKVALTQYSMEHLEAVGLLKMDFLGLRTLSIIERTLDWIEKLGGGSIDLRSIPDDDPATYEMLSRGDTTGIFQLESAGMRRVLRELKPSCFEDIISVLALYRPGPMEFIPRYIEAKHGRADADYPHADLEPILRDTYGIIVYQEQIMQIASRMAGFSLGEADLLRRAVSKKKREVLDKEREHFVAGSLKQGYQASDAHLVYDMIVRFADYGFPRAHATAYGVLAYRTAYLKANYPVPFMASMLTSVMGNHRKMAEYADECRRMRIRVLGPDVNESNISFTPLAGAPDGDIGAIRFGLAAVKNVGTQAMESIIKERKSGPYSNLADFCNRVDLRVCNKRVIESLILAGGMDAMDGHRAQLLAALDETADTAAKRKKERDELQLDMFGFQESVNWQFELPDVPAFSRARELELERELLGLYLSGHPLDDYRDKMEALGVVPLHELEHAPDNRMVEVAGRVLSVKPIVSKKGKAMAFMELEDRIERVEVVVFPETWSRYGPEVEKGRLLFLRARVQQQDGEQQVKLLADMICSLDEAEPGSAAVRPDRQPRKRHQQAGAASVRNNAPGRQEPPAAAPSRPARSHAAAPAASGAKQKVFVKIAADKETPALLKELQVRLQQHPGPLPVVLYYEREGRTLVLNERYRIKPSRELFAAIEERFGKDTVKVK